MRSWSVVYILVVCTGVALGGSRLGHARSLAASKTYDDWWTNGTFYQIDPAFFRDSNGDCKGDLMGINEKVKYLEAMNVAGVILSPIHREDSFTDINPDFGDMDDFSAMVKTLTESKINVILEFDFSSTTKEHPWFKYNPDYYFKISADDDINDWLSTENLEAWYKNDSYNYLAFFDKRPQLNFSNADVVKEIENVMTFWMDKGVNGFKLTHVSYLAPSQRLENETATSPCSSPDKHSYPCIKHNSTINTKETFSLIKSWSSYINTSNQTQRILIAVPYIQSDEEDDAENFVKNGASLVLGTVLSDDGFKLAESCSFDGWIKSVTKPAWTTWYNRSEILNHMNVDAYNMITAFMPGAYFPLYGDEIGMAATDTGFKWDTTQFAGFSNCSNPADPTKVVNPDYFDSNLMTEQSASLSHYVVFERLKKIHPNLEKFNFQCLNFATDKIFGFSRGTTDKIYVVLFNMDLIEQKLDLSAVNITQKTLNVEVPSVSSAYKIGDSLEANNITLRPVSCLVLTDGTVNPDTSSAVRHTTAFGLLILTIARFLF